MISINVVSVSTFRFPLSAFDCCVWQSFGSGVPLFVFVWACVWCWFGSGFIRNTATKHQPHTAIKSGKPLTASVCMLSGRPLSMCTQNDYHTQQSKRKAATNQHQTIDNTKQKRKAEHRNQTTTTHSNQKRKTADSNCLHVERQAAVNVTAVPL